MINYFFSSSTASLNFPVQTRWYTSISCFGFAFHRTISESSGKDFACFYDILWHHRRSVIQDKILLVNILLLDFESIR